MKKKLFKYSIYLVGVMGFLVLLLLASARYTSRPGFCSTCHYMESYVEGWKTSTHADVTCTDCHFPPGFKSKVRGKFTAASMVVNYMTGIYKRSKPWAEITDESCLRSGCHEERLLAGQVIFKEGIIFDHEPHVTRLRRGKKLRCTSCHSQIVQGDHITVTESTCFLCHFRNQPEEVPIDDCTWCHEAPIATGFGEVKYNHLDVVARQIECQKCHGRMQVGDGTVPLERCSVCHAETGLIERYDEIEFIHKNHVTDHKVECQNCHLVIQHKSVSGTAGIMPECQGCHENIHTSQIRLFSGRGGEEGPPHPDPMFKVGLNCQACHIFHQAEGGSAELGQTRVARGEACEKCHGKGYGHLFQQWEQVMAEKTALLEETLEAVEKELGIGDTAGKANSQVKNWLDQARYKFQLVKQGNIVHNVAYSDELLYSAWEDLKNALVDVNSDHRLPEVSFESPMVPSECKNCHYGQEEIDVTAFGINFSHNVHIVKNRLPCAQCHSNMRRHGELTMARSDCLSCHHAPEVEDCERCHVIQSQIYAGSTTLAATVQPDVMYAQEVDCRACHENDDGIIREGKGESCTLCHAEDYGDLLVDWQDETRRLISEISTSLSLVDYEGLSRGDRKMVDRVRSGLKVIRSDKSFGAHNIELIGTTLRHYREILAAFPKQMG